MTKDRTETLSIRRYFRATLQTLCAALALFGASHGRATSCQGVSQDAESVAERFGGADVVFVGKIESVDPTEILRSHSASVRAMVVVERVFKGELKGVVETFLDLHIFSTKHTMAPGKRLILYATRETTEDIQNRLPKAAAKAGTTSQGRASLPALLADGSCAQGRRWMPADGPWGSAELRYLEALPKAGSGGTLRLNLIVRSADKWLDARKRWFESVPVALQMGSSIVNASTDDKGEATFLNLPPSIYKLTVPQVPGFSVACDYGMSCEKLKVTDRGLHKYTAEYAPNASLGVELTNFEGAVVNTTVAYKLTRVDAPATTRGHPFPAPSAVQFTVNLRSSPRTGHPNRDVSVPPGKYTLELLLTQYKKAKAGEDDKYATLVETGRQLIESPGLGVFDLRAGDNAIVFKLPPSLAPIAVRYLAQFPRLIAGGKPSYAAEFVQLNPRGSREWSYTPHVAPLNVGESAFFMALPGQTWLLSAEDEKHRMVAKRTVVINSDPRFTLSMKKVTR